MFRSVPCPKRPSVLRRSGSYNVESATLTLFGICSMAPQVKAKTFLNVSKICVKQNKKEQSGL